MLCSGTNPLPLEVIAKYCASVLFNVPIALRRTVRKNGGMNGMENRRILRSSLISHFVDGF
jgi:hypothetical protein